MPSRYARTPLIDLARQYGTSFTPANIRSGIEAGLIPYTTMTLKGFQRLDTIAALNYNDGRLWWVIAAASNIGWGLQVPPGTFLRIPDINAITKLVG